MTTLIDIPPPEPLRSVPGWRHAHVASIGSTNATIMEAARNGTVGPLWLTADEQVTGKGRRGRAWSSPRGNLYASALLTASVPEDAFGQLPFVVSLAVHDAVIAVLPPERQDAVRIKWPNDVLIDGAKCCGILLETEKLRDGSRAIVVGCGLNLVAHPADTPYPATNLRAEGSDADLATLFAHLARAFDALLARWDGGRNFSAIRSEWLSHASGIGRRVTVNLAQGTLEGIFEGIDADGLFLLRQEHGGLIPVSAGDVFPQ